MKSSGILVLIVVAISFFSCKPVEIILYGEISGLVTDTTTSQPLELVPVKLNPINDTTNTTSDGKYLFKSLIPGDYEIEVSKPPYASGKRSATVTSASITEVNFALHKIPHPLFSNRYLDFGLDSMPKYMTIKNTGIGKLKYDITPGQDWITVYPVSGEVTTETDTIMVTINRTELSEIKYKESIDIISHIGQDIMQDEIYVFLNGVLDYRDLNYYGIVKIGTQIWMKENLNVGTMNYVWHSAADSSSDNEIIERYCYENNVSNCDIYGGLYQWAEMMQYNPPDTGLIGTTQGVCLDGWHLPTFKEWETLMYFLGGYKKEGKAGYFGIGDKLKESGSSHWKVPNSGATNESGFTALPGGGLASFSEEDWLLNRWTFSGIGYDGFWMITRRNSGIHIFHSDDSNNIADVLLNIPMEASNGTKSYAFSVRCIKNPGKR
jgi:uncharacterized protein (TIGR02145 family)